MWRPTWLLVAALVIGIGAPAGPAVVCRSRSGILRLRDACKPLETDVAPSSLVRGAIYTRTSTVTPNGCVSVESGCDRASDILLTCEGGEAQSNGDFVLRALRRDGPACQLDGCSPAGTSVEVTATCLGQAATATTTTTLPALCSTAVVIPPEGGTFTGATSGFSMLAGTCGLSGASPEAAFRWTPALTGMATIDTCAGTDYDTVLYVRTATCADGARELCNDDACGLGSRIQRFVVAEQPYFIIVDGFNGAQGSFTLTVAPPTTSTTTSTSSTTTTTNTTTTTTIGGPTTTTTTATSTTTTTLCMCGGGDPTKLSFMSSVGSGACGHLDADGDPSFFPLACDGFYFGGAGVGVPLPVIMPALGTSVIAASCVGTTVTLTGATPAEAGGKHCTAGVPSKRGASCLANSDCASPCNTSADCTLGGTCSGGSCSNATCAKTNCTNAGCLFGPPLPIPNTSHSGAATSTCVINTLTANATGSADCAAGSVTGLNLPLTSAIFLDADLMPMRCSGGSNDGGNCTGSGGCGTVAPDSCPGGICVNDTGRCSGNRANCCSDADCPSSSCETGVCVGGANAGLGCTTDADCQGGTCRTLIQPCPICNAATSACDGGPNEGLTCTPVVKKPLNGDLPTSHDCPPPPANNLGALPIAFVLDSGTISKTAVDMTDQSNVFCAFCKNKTLDTFARRCNGSASGAACACAVGVPCPACSGAPCLPVPCTSNTDCATVTGFVSCGQRTAGAFTSLDTARTIVETGSPAGALTSGGLGRPATLVSIFCLPLTFNTLVDSADDLPGPGAVAVPVQVQLQP